MKMKVFSILFFILGLALASALPLQSRDHDLEIEKVFNDLFEDVTLEDDNDAFNVVTVREKFEDFVKRVKELFEKGKSLKDVLDKLQSIRGKLKDLDIDVGDNGREYLDLLKEKVKECWKELIEKLSYKRSADIDVFGMLEEIKQMIRDRFDTVKIQEFIRKVFGKGSEFYEHLSKLLRDENSKEKISEWITKIFGENQLKRSISDIYKKVREYFKDLNIELKEKFINFGEWVKKRYGKALEKGKTKAENIKRIAKEFLEDYSVMSKDIAADALDFFRENKKDLGDLFEKVSNKLRETLKH